MAMAPKKPVAKVTAKPASTARVSKAELNKVTETAKQKPKVKITGSASTPPRVSSSMVNSQPKTTSKPKAPVVAKTTKTPAMPTKPKPAVGTDKDAKKKYGSSSWNNGYTN